MTAPDGVRPSAPAPTLVGPWIDAVVDPDDARADRRPADVPRPRPSSPAPATMVGEPLTAPVPVAAPTQVAPAWASPYDAGAPATAWAPDPQAEPATPWASPGAAPAWTAAPETAWAPAPPPGAAAPWASPTPRPATPQPAVPQPTAWAPAPVPHAPPYGPDRAWAETVSAPQPGWASHSGAPHAAAAPASRLPVAVAAALVLVLVVGAGAAGVWWVRGRSGTSTTAAPINPAPTTAVAPAPEEPAPGEPVAPPVLDQPPGERVGGPASGGLPTAPPAPDVATGLVRLDPAAAAHLSADTVSALLGRHFAAINDRDYEAWRATVVPRRAADQPRDEWSRAFRSTRDSDVVVHGIAQQGGGLVVELSFVSEQDVAEAPPDLPVPRICWNARWPVTNGLLDRPQRGSTTKQAC